MKLKILRPEIYPMTVPLMVTASVNPGATRTSYIIGAVIAILILGYLLYSLFKPDKF